MNLYLNESVQIAEQLIQSSIKDVHGIYWETLLEDIVKKKKTKIKSETVYNGTSGIALFFIELYKVTLNKKYKEIAKKGIQWSHWNCLQYKNSNYAFITGRMGITYAWLKLYEIDKNKTYIKNALQLTKGVNTFLKTQKTNDYFVGTSGTLLVLIHLHGITKEKWVLKSIDIYIKTLLQNAKYGKKGIYWDAYPQQIRPISGFSHGASGIGFVFLELARYFNNPSFYTIAQQSFLYENSYFDKKIYNWPDFRVDLWDKEALIDKEKDFKEGKLQNFMKTKNINIWSYGAAGIGVVRLHSYNLFKNNSDLSDAKKAIKKTLKTSKKITTGKDTITYDLVSGYGGIAEIFIEAYLCLQDKKYLSYAQKIAKYALSQKKDSGKYHLNKEFSTYDPYYRKEDYSLFNGIAGIGYFLLRVYNPEKVTSILLPKFDLHNTTSKAYLKLYPHIIFQKSINEIMITNTFPRTITLIKKYYKTELINYARFSTKKEFKQFIIQLLYTLSGNHKMKLHNIFAIEYTKANLLEKRFTSNNVIYTSSYVYIQDRIAQKCYHKIENMSQKKIMHLSLTLNANSKIVSFTSPEYSSILIKLTPYGVEETELNYFSDKVLSCLKKENTIENAVKKIIKLYNITEDKNIHFAEQQILLQIKEGIKYNVLQIVSG